MRRALVVFAHALALAGCGNLLGIPSEVTETDAGTDASDDVNTCNPAQDTDPCFQCTDQNCCPQYTACHDDPRCGDYYKVCLPQCKMQGNTYAACVVQCDSQYGAGHAEFAPYHACGEEHCLAQCSNGDGSVDPCTSCLYSSCRDQAVACTADRDCDTLFECLVTCQGQANYDSCASACQAGKPQQAIDAVNAETTCALQFCQQVCSIP